MDSQIHTIGMAIKPFFADQIAYNMYAVSALLLLLFEIIGQNEDRVL